MLNDRLQHLFNFGGLFDYDGEEVHELVRAMCEAVDSGKQFSSEVLHGKVKEKADFLMTRSKTWEALLEDVKLGRKAGNSPRFIAKNAIVIDNGTMGTEYFVFSEKKKEIKNKYRSGDAPPMGFKA